MKSAWMLITVGLVATVLVAGGCTQPGWGITPPVKRADAAEQEPATVAQPTGAAPHPTFPTSRPHVDEEDPNDPTVAQLTRQIEALAAQSSAAQSVAAPSSQPAEFSSAPAQPTPAPATPAATTAPAPVVASASPPQAPRQAIPAPTAPPTSAPAPIVAALTGAVPPEDTSSEPMVANAPTPGLFRNPAASEAIASPTPRQVPPIQPTTPAPAVTVEITDVRAVISKSGGEPDPVAASANQPALSNPQPQPADLQSVIEKLATTLQARPPRPQDELQLRLLYLAAGMNDKSAEPVRGMDPIQTELLTAIVSTVASARRAMLEPTASSSAALTAVDELRRLLGQQSGVSIPRVALVTKVASYGDYDVISPLRFKAGQEIHAYVYTEIANFRSEPTEDNRLRTLVAERVQVFEASGEMVWERYEKNIEDRTRTPRRDFFIPFPLKLPATLAPGEYVLKVTIEDRIGSTTDQQRLSFSIE